ncbi:apurinic endonuclease [Necator americanus]|uniref:Apurinic endonuclease n=1 Tax=Necator americanus TaxID=51031 RepID=W2TED8_NECAM|nr:apurinic endonuclease [Necator americanus]ETN79949.1 apurinic endonuclease [Necator americanus]
MKKSRTRKIQKLDSSPIQRKEKEEEEMVTATVENHMKKELVDNPNDGGKDYLPSCVVTKIGCDIMKIFTLVGKRDRRDTEDRISAPEKKKQAKSVQSKKRTVAPSEMKTEQGSEETSANLESLDRGDEEKPMSKRRKKQGPQSGETRAILQEITTQSDENPVIKPEPTRKSKPIKSGESEILRNLRLTVGAKVLAAAGNSKKNLGSHVSAAGSLEQAIYNARAEGNRCFALFVRNQRQWNSKPMEDATVERWNDALKETGFPLSQIVPHGSYLMNPGSPDPEKLQKSREAMVQNKDRVGVCIDTCHIFAAGYDIRNKESYNATMNKFDKIVGLKYLKAVHLNDSKGGVGCHADRHENIGKGKIGKNGFRCLMEDERLNGIPLILETPGMDYPGEMMTLYSLQKR